MYAAMWGLGGTFMESGEDEQFYREFQRLWKGQSRIKYPEVKMGGGKNLSIFDFYFDLQEIQWK
ncbi:MAG: hypothetical protein DHS20C13_29470 [Thermodesulfobacteriota bacterium]|nr:MAG: hypothetical protein DHS20C13_29470 [Thermodesulfobacteriota bacterium]